MLSCSEGYDGSHYFRSCVRSIYGVHKLFPQMKSRGIVPSSGMFCCRALASHTVEQKTNNVKLASSFCGQSEHWPALRSQMYSIQLVGITYAIDVRRVTLLPRSPLYFQPCSTCGSLTSHDRTQYCVRCATM